MKIIIIILLIELVGGYVQAADKLLFTSGDIPRAGKGRKHRTKVVEVPVTLNLDLAEQLTNGQQFDIPLLNGKTVLGTVQNVTTNQHGDTVEIVSFEKGKGSLQLTIEGNTISELLLFDKKKTKFYRADLDANGVGVFVEEDPNIHVCVKYPMPVTIAAQSISDRVVKSTPDIATLKTLQSKPSAPNVIYIDFWGGTLSGTVWNDRYNSGKDIDYTPFDIDNKPDSFSDKERYLIWLGWREVVEDFALFNVNITTDLAVYNATPLTNRIRNISTATNFFFRGAGGVAFRNAFGRSTDYFAVSWTWNDTASSHGMSISHELGHQFGLFHDGNNDDEYHSGLANWGPVMGAPFGNSYVQWSMGEYSGATNFENDIDIIKAQLDAVVNDIDDTIATATNIDTTQTELIGLITPFELFGTDVDYYKFSVLSSAPIRIDIAPLIIAENHDELFGTNLSMEVALLNEQQFPIAEVNPSFSPAENRFVYDDILETGTYYLEISASSPETALGPVFEEYGNGGKYSVVISTGVSEGFYKLDTEHSFEWIDATFGTRLDISDTDDATESISIGFDFEFYGRSYSELTIDSNGYLSFDDSPVNFDNMAIPTNSSPNGFIAPYWDDIYPGASETANIFSLLEGTAPNRRLTIAWIETFLLSGSTDSPVTFEVTLYEGSNDIIFQYDNAYLADSATIGIEHQSGDFGLQYLHNGQNNGQPVQIRDEQAIRFFIDESRTAGFTFSPTDDANNRAMLDGVLAISKWEHAFFRFDTSDIDSEVSRATLRVYYAARRAPLTLFVGAVDDDNWSEVGRIPAVTLIHDRPELQLDSVDATTSGYVEFDVTDFVAEQVNGDSIVTLAVSSNHDKWDKLSSKEGTFPAELIIETQDTVAPSVPTNLALNSETAAVVRFSWTPSTDDRGTVALYHIMRDGIKIGTSVVASFIDNTVVADTRYVYNVTAEDDSGNESAISDDLVVNRSIAEKTTIIPSDDANNRAMLDGVLATSKWEHAFFRFDASAIQQEINKATLRIYYQARRAPLTLFVGAVDDDNWSEDSNTPRLTYIHNRPDLQLDSVEVIAPGYVEFDVTDFVAAQVISDGIVTVEVSSSLDRWDIFNSKEGSFPPELVIR